MTTTWVVSILAWVALTAGVITLALYRKVLARGEYDALYLREIELARVPRQEAFAHRLATVDFWSKVLTVASVSYGVLLGTLVLYRILSQSLNT